MEDRSAHTRQGNVSVAITIGGLQYRGNEWSFGGFLLDADPADLPLGTLVCIDSVRSHKKKPKPVEIRARVVRASGDRAHVALSSLHLNDDAFRVLDELRR